MTNQLTQADLDGMTPQEIVTAKHEGRLASLLGVPAEEVALIERSAGDVSDADIKALAHLGRHDLISNAHTEGRINFNQGENA